MTEEPDNPYGDLPIPEAAAKANDLILQGMTLYFKFTCANCGARLTFEEPNTIYQSGTCDRCGHVTLIKRIGFLAEVKLPRSLTDE